MSRPQRISTAAILKAATQVIGELGPQQLTLEAVGQRVGLVPGTLMQRFGSKRGLLLALSQAGLAQLTPTLHGALEQAVQQEKSPLEGLVTGLSELYQDLKTPSQLANHLAFLQHDLQDPEFKALARAHAQALIDCLKQAIQAGEAQLELRPGDPLEQAELLYQILQGVLIHWALFESGPLAKAVEKALRRTWHQWLRQETQATETTATLRNRTKQAKTIADIQKKKKKSKKDKKNAQGKAKKHD